MTHSNTSCQLSTAGGSVLSIIFTLDPGDLIKSAILAVIGTIVSYAISRLMRILFERKA